MKAVIYCRVSSDKQVREGNGLEGQEKRCRDYAFYNGYEVDKVFRDEGVSGGIIDRPAMKALLNYVDARGGKYVVIIDDINRLARDMIAHITLRKAIKDTNCFLECVNMKLEDNPEGHFIETIMAASAELERNRSTRQVNNRMKARLELGYWVFDNPPGYKYDTQAAHGKILVPDEPKASIVREAFEGFASGRFLIQQDVQAFLTEKKFCHRAEFKKVHLEQVKRILTRSLYAGIIDYPHWDIKSFQGKHEAIISLELFQKVQDKLFGRSKQSFARKSDNEDFPIRGCVLCPGCEKPYTASWSRGRKNKYPYYRCNSKQCVNTQKSIKKDILEKMFVQVLEAATPVKQVINLARAITLDVYNKKMKQVDSIAVDQDKELLGVEKQIISATGKLIATTSQTVIAALEKKIEELEIQKQQIQQSITKLRTHDIDFGTALNAVMNFMENPQDAWVRGDLRQKRLVQKLVFVRPIAMHPKTGIGTADLSLPFKLLKDISSGKNELVGRRQSHLISN